MNKMTFRESQETNSPALSSFPRFPVPTSGPTRARETDKSHTRFLLYVLCIQHNALTIVFLILVLVLFLFLSIPNSHRLFRDAYD